jgi:signal transduction histidine kinase/DNA-binding response OmpR family regulator
LRALDGGPQSGVSRVAQGPPAVLLVDDIPANLVALGAVLEQLDVRMVEARSGDEALRAIEREPFAVVLLDVQMPGMDGFETARRIRALPGGREVPILFLTAIHRDESNVRRGYASGAADYITKPFDVDILRARVRAFADLYRQREAAHRERLDARIHELDETQRKLAAFERISTAALETDDLGAFLHTLLTIFAGAADSASTATILLRQRDELVTAASIGIPEDVGGRTDVAVGEGFAGRIAATGRPMLLVGTAIRAMVKISRVRDLGLRALYGVPLLHDGAVIGVAHIGSTIADGFTEAEKRLFQAMVDRAAWTVSRTRARDRLYTVLDEAPTAISVWRGSPFVCDYANRAYRSLFPGAEVLGKPPHGATRETIALLERVMELGETVEVAEQAWSGELAGEGRPEERIFRVSLHPLPGALGRPEAVLSVAIELTEQVHARRALEESERARAHLLELEKEARREAESASQAKDAFLATVSHELRTPLNAILGWTTSLRRGIVTDVDRALAIIERNAHAQTRIIEDVLDLSRIVSGKLRLDVAATDISHALLAAVEAVRPTAVTKDIHIDVRISDPLGIVLADTDRIQQIVWNLLANAVKFTPAQGKVTLTAVRRGNKVVVSVTDSGQGIDPAFLPHVFDAFRQADGSTTRRHGGLGLGLTIVKQLVEAHGGAVRAESDGVGAGSTFVVELPARKLPAIEELARRDTIPMPAAADLHGLRVLVVDDDGDSRVLLRELLAKQGATVEVAASAGEAVECVETFRPHVLVTDIGMPDADGYQLLRTVRALPPDAGGDTPAIALTAYARPEDRDRASEEGFTLHVSKPVDPEQLVSFVAELGRGPS